MPTAGALAPSQIARRSVRMLPAGRIVRQYPVLNPEEANSATEVYLQVGPDVGDDWIHLAVLAQLIEQPLYEELRTRQQLGYIVQSAITDTEGVRGLIVSVQSAVLPPPQVRRARAHRMHPPRVRFVFHCVAAAAVAHFGSCSHAHDA